MSLVVDIEKQLGTFHLNVQLEADQQPLALLGASGCGKSLTLRCIAGILKPDSGKILLNGKTLFDSAAHINLPPQARHIGYLFQQYALFPNMTVRKNIACAVPDHSKREQITAEKLRQFHLEAVADLRPAQLSGGQQQRTALARILASSPDVILLDEPLSALDTYLRYQLELELTETLEKFNGPVVWVSHDRGEAFRSCKQVCILDQGHSQGITTMEALFHHPKTEAAARLSGCQNFIAAIPQGNQLFLPQWNLALPYLQPLSQEIDLLGIRAHQIFPDKDGFPCRVLRVIQNIFSTIVLLRPVSAAEDSPPLRMELSKEVWDEIAGQETISVSIDPHSLLLLNTKGDF